MDNEIFFKPSVTVDILVFTFDKTEKDIQVLLIKRKNPPFKDCWAFPGGFIEKDETLEQSARRELLEETSLNVEIGDLEQINAAGNPGRDPRGRTISIIYLTYVEKEKVHPKGQDDARKAKWFSIFNPPPLAFDHKEILDSAILYFKYKMNEISPQTGPLFSQISSSDRNIIKSFFKI